MATTLSDYPVVSFADDCKTSLYSLFGDAVTVIDFWTTQCVKCPNALEKLNGEAEKFPNVKFFSCVLNDKDVAKDLVEDTWENMTHLFMALEDKENLKKEFGFTQNGKVVASGNPKDINLGEAIASAESQTFGALQLDEDF